MHAWQIDYATGFLAAYGVMLALIDRQLAATSGQVRSARSRRAPTAAGSAL